MSVLALEDVISSKLLALGEHALDYEAVLAIVRAVRERVDWTSVRARTWHSPYARAFFALLEELDIEVERPVARSPVQGARVRVVPPVG